jgi:hypothetical protein
VRALVRTVLAGSGYALAEGEPACTTRHFGNAATA